MQPERPHSHKGSVVIPCPQKQVPPPVEYTGKYPHNAAHIESTYRGVTQYQATLQAIVDNDTEGAHTDLGTPG